MNEYGWSDVSNVIYARTNPEHVGKYDNWLDFLLVASQLFTRLCLLKIFFVYRIWFDVSKAFEALIDKKHYFEMRLPNSPKFCSGTATSISYMFSPTRGRLFFKEHKGFIKEPN